MSKVFAIWVPAARNTHDFYVEDDNCSVYSTETVEKAIKTLAREYKHNPTMTVVIADCETWETRTLRYIVEVSRSLAEI